MRKVVLAFTVITSAIFAFGSASPQPVDTADLWLRTNVSTIRFPGDDIFSFGKPTLGFARSADTSDILSRLSCGASACLYGATWSPDHRYVAFGGEIRGIDEVFVARASDAVAARVSEPTQIARSYDVCRSGRFDILWATRRSLTLTLDIGCGLEDIIMDRTQDEHSSLPRWLTDGAAPPEPTAAAIAEVSTLVNLPPLINDGPTDIALQPGPARGSYVVAGGALLSVSDAGPTHVLLQQDPSPGSEDASVTNVVAVQASADGRSLVVADSGISPGPGPKFFDVDLAENPPKVRLFAKGVFGGMSGFVLNASHDELYVSDEALNQIYAIPRNGEPISIAGGCEPGVHTCPGGDKDGPRSIARFNDPGGIAIDPENGDLYVADTANDSIRRIDPKGDVTTLAGACIHAAPYTDCAPGFRDGAGADARFFFPQALVFDENSRALYVADTWNNAVRRVTLDGRVTTVAGAATPGFIDGHGTSARFDHPSAITTDPKTGDLFVADYNNLAVRQVTRDGSVLTRAKRIATFGKPSAMAVSSEGDIYLAEDRIGEFAPGSITFEEPTRVIGGSADPPLSFLDELAVDTRGNVYVSDGLPRVLIFPRSADLFSPPSKTIQVSSGSVDALTVDDKGELFIGSRSRIFVYDAWADGEPRLLRVLQGRNTRLAGIGGLATDESGRLYVSSSTNIGSGEVLTFGPRAHDDAIPITRLAVSCPGPLVVDAQGRLYVGDCSEHGVLVFAPGAHGDVAPVRVISSLSADEASISSLSIDGSGNLYVLGLTQWHVDRFGI